MNNTSKIHIKNMVCPRCVMAVQHILARCGIEPIRVELGWAEISDVLDDKTYDTLRCALEEYGFEVLEDPQKTLVDAIRVAVIKRIHYTEDQNSDNLSEYLSQEFHRDYSSLSKLFSEINGMSIERYYLLQRIERVKELLSYGELSVSEIADQLHFSSVAHLSAQFRNITGYSPTAFRHLKENPLKSLDEI